MPFVRSQIFQTWALFINTCQQENTTQVGFFLLLLLLGLMLRHKNSSDDHVSILNRDHRSSGIPLWLLEFLPCSVRWIAVVPVERIGCRSDGVPKGKKNPKLPADSPPLSLTAVCWRHTSALSPLPSLLTFLSTSSDTEMRLEIELCIFHEVPNASAPAAPPRFGLCFALSIPNNFFFLFFFFYDLTAYSCRGKTSPGK